MWDDEKYFTLLNASFWHFFESVSPLSLSKKEVILISSTK